MWRPTNQDHRRDRREVDRCKQPPLRSTFRRRPAWKTEAQKGWIRCVNGAESSPTPRSRDRDRCVTRSPVSGASGFVKQAGESTHGLMQLTVWQSCRHRSVSTSSTRAAHGDEKWFFLRGGLLVRLIWKSRGSVRRKHLQPPFWQSYCTRRRRSRPSKSCLWSEKIKEAQCSLEEMKKMSTFCRLTHLKKRPETPAEMETRRSGQETTQ